MVQNENKTIDIRDIDLAYFHPWKNYSLEEEELFKKPTQSKNFKKRIELLIKRKDSNRLGFLPKGDGNFYLTLKKYVLNLIPTQNEELASEIYAHLYDVLGKEKLKTIVKIYANYLERFKPNEK